MVALVPALVLGMIPGMIFHFENDFVPTFWKSYGQVCGWGFGDVGKVSESRLVWGGLRTAR